MSNTSTKFDLALLGYRNDLARERVLAFLRNLAPERGGPIDVHRDATLPLVLVTALDQEQGLHLVTELRQRGGHARLQESASSPAVAAPPPDTARRTSTIPTVLVALASAALIFAAVNVHMRRPALAPDLAALIADSVGSAELPLQRHHLNDTAVDLNAAGHFEEAADRLYEAIEANPGEQVLLGNLVVVLRNWAVSEINAGRPTTAVGLLLEALDIRQDVGILALLGIAQERIGDHHNAEVNLNEALELGTTDPMAFVALGRIYREQGDQEGAVEMLQRARELGARGPDFDKMLRRLERELDAEWDFVGLDTPHFRLSFAQGESHEAAQIVSEVLEDAYFSVGRKLDYFPDTPTDVVLYASEDFHSVTQTPDWTGGVYDGRIKLPVRGITRGGHLLERTLRHEYGHVLVTKLGNGRVPVWLNEGLAIWAEEQADGDRKDWARRMIAGQRLFTLRELVPPFTRLPPNRVQVAYAQSYLAIRLIIEDYGERRVLEILDAVADGNSVDDAFETVLATTLADFQADLIDALTS